LQGCPSLSFRVLDDRLTMCTRKNYGGHDRWTRIVLPLENLFGPPLPPITRRYRSDLRTPAQCTERPILRSRRPVRSIPVGRSTIETCRIEVGLSRPVNPHEVRCAAGGTANVKLTFNRTTQRG